MVENIYATDEVLQQRIEIASNDYWQDLFQSMIENNPSMKD